MLLRAYKGVVEKELEMCWRGGSRTFSCIIDNFRIIDRGLWVVLLMVFVFNWRCQAGLSSFCSRRGQVRDLLFETADTISRGQLVRVDGPALAVTCKLRDLDIPGDTRR